jgi:hypothetical protein
MKSRNIQIRNSFIIFLVVLTTTCKNKSETFEEYYNNYSNYIEIRDKYIECINVSIIDSTSDSVFLYNEQGKYLLFSKKMLDSIDYSVYQDNKNEHLLYNIRIQKLHRIGNNNTYKIEHSCNRDLGLIWTIDSVGGNNFKHIFVYEDSIGIIGFEAKYDRLIYGNLFPYVTLMKKNEKKIFSIQIPSPINTDM